MALSEHSRDGESRFLGVMLINRMENLSMLRGRAVHDAVQSALPDTVRQTLRDRHATSRAWFPMEYLRDLHAAIDRATGGGLSLSRQLGYFGTQKSFGRMGTLVAGLVEPSVLLRRASRIFRTYYDTGKLELVTTQQQMVVARWSGCTGFNAHIWQVTFGSTEAMLELSRARSPHVEVVGGGNEGDDFAEITALWH